MPAAMDEVSRGYDSDILNGNGGHHDAGDEGDGGNRIMMTPCRFFKEDVVTWKTPDDEFIGIVIKVGHNEDSDYEDSSDDSDYDDDDSLISNTSNDKLLPGTIRIVSEPDGITRVLETSNESLRICDRSFMHGDSVMRTKSNDERDVPDALQVPESGVVVAIRLECNVQDILHKNPVIRNVDSRRLEPLVSLEVGVNIVYQGWIGVVDDIFEEVVVDFGEKFGGELLFDVDFSAMLERPDDRSGYGCRQFYPSCTVEASTDLLRDAVPWPVESGRRLPRELPVSIVQGVVTEVHISGISVNWLEHSERDNMGGDVSMPPDHLQAEDLKNVTPLAALSNASHQVGHVLYLLPQLDQIMAPVDGALSLSERHSEIRPAPGKRIAWDDDVKAADRAFSLLHSTHLPVRQQPITLNSVPNSCPTLSDLVLPSEMVHRGAVITEHLPMVQIMGTRTYVDILWQNGKMEYDVPTITLLPFNNHLDDLSFWPGEFVYRADTPPPPDVYFDLSLPKGCGLLTSVNIVNRTCVVNWFDESGDVNVEEVSAYDIRELATYDFAPGKVVQRKVNHPELPSFGIVFFMDTNGLVGVAWSNCTFSYEPVFSLLLVDIDIDSSNDEEDDWETDEESGWETDDNSNDNSNVIHVDIETGAVSIAADALLAETLALDNNEVKFSDTAHQIVSALETAASTAAGMSARQGDTEGAEELMNAASVLRDAVGLRSVSATVTAQHEELENSDELILSADVTDTAQEFEFLSKDVEPFVILETELPNHFFNSVDLDDTPLSRSFLRALHSDYRLLSSSLPPGILVRATSERSDLLTSIIWGPRGTPYEGNMFIFDIQLPSTYPSLPPKVAFHHTAISGRINPNLYEDGKVCLSLLDTWLGKGSEKWNEEASNLLQVLVSIQGLIFVKEPYYNEAGYTKQIGTSVGMANSRLYNESCLLRCVEALTMMARKPHPLFVDVITSNFTARGQDILSLFYALQNDEFSGDDPIEFLIRPTSQGFKDVLNRKIMTLKSALDFYFN